MTESKMNKVNKVVALIGFLAACFAAAAIGSIFTDSVRSGWFLNLNKPSWNPPSWVFAPVWTVLYAAMAIAAFLVWRRKEQAAVAWALRIFVIQLVLNAIWSPIFFGLRDVVGGVAVIVPLWALILLTTILFWRISRAAGIIMLPYLAWVTFAAALNISIWRLNS